MARSNPARPVRPLDLAGLNALAVNYLGKFATTEMRLAAYLNRKIEQRGWQGDGAPPIEEIVARCAAVGYVDDRNFAQARASSLTRRGYGQRRVIESLRAAGVAHDITAAVLPDRDASFSAAQAYARRRRFGPFGDMPPDAAQRQRQISAMVRAGHDFDLARHFVTSARSDDEGDAKSD